MSSRITLTQVRDLFAHMSEDDLLQVSEIIERSRPYSSPVTEEKHDEETNKIYEFLIELQG